MAKGISDCALREMSDGGIDVLEEQEMLVGNCEQSRGGNGYQWEGGQENMEGNGNERQIQILLVNKTRLA